MWWATARSIRNEELTDSISWTVERLEKLESGGTSTLDDDATQAFLDVYRHYFLKGAHEELQKKALEKLKLSHPPDEIRTTLFVEKSDDGHRNCSVS